jgi:hypothetical protein
MKSKMASLSYCLRRSQRSQTSANRALNRRAIHLVKGLQNLAVIRLFVLAMSRGLRLVEARSNTHRVGVLAGLLNRSAKNQWLAVERERL